MDTRKLCELYANIGHHLIKRDPDLEYIKHSDATIVFLSSAHKKIGKGKVIFGECEKVPEKYRWGIPCDFTITIFEPNVEKFTREQIEMLLFHELNHVGIEKTDDGEKYYIKPHDLEDFKVVIDRYGTEWSKTKEE